MPNLATLIVIHRGFDGKLPSRGDFVGRGLPRTFLAPWRAWVDAALSSSRSRLGEAWLPAWLEAPIWRFALPAGTCGPDAVLGLMIPSVDNVGRHYPLTLAAAFAGMSAVPAAFAWLDEIEVLALDALARDVTPDDLMNSLGLAPEPVMEGSLGGGQWWTTGSPRVPAARVAMAGLPAPVEFAGMIDADTRL